ncbi:hypothetical protein FOZ62_011851, partial [Perkinsus olseni]
KRRRRRRRMQQEQEDAKKDEKTGGEDTDGSTSSASDSRVSTANAKSEIKTQPEAEGQEASPSGPDRPPKMRKRGRLITAGPLAAAVGENGGSVEEGDVEMKTEETTVEEESPPAASTPEGEVEGPKGDEQPARDDATIMPLVYQLVDPSRDRTSLHCLSPVSAMQWSPTFDGLLATANADGQLALFWSPVKPSDGGGIEADQREWNRSPEGGDGVMGYLMVDASTSSNDPLLHHQQQQEDATAQQQAYLSWSSNRGALAVIAMASESCGTIKLRWVQREAKGYSIAGRLDLKYPQGGDEQQDEDELEIGGYHAVEFCGTDGVLGGSSPMGPEFPEGSTIAASAASSTYLAASVDESVVIWQVDCNNPGEAPELMFKIDDTPSYTLAWLGSTYLALGTLSPYTLLVDTRDNAQKKLMLAGVDEDDGSGSSNGSNRFILECAFDDSGSKRLAAITDSEPTDAYITVWMDPTARRPGKPIVLRANSEGGTPLQAQEMLRWMPGSDGDVLCAAYEGGLVVVWDLLSQSVLYRLPCIDAITAIAWQHQPYLRIHNGGGGDAAAPPLLVTMMLGRKCVVWSEGRVVSAFDLRCDDENAPGYIAWCPPDPSLPAYGNYLAASAGGNETPLIFDATPVVKEASRRFMTGVKQQQQQVKQ